MGLREIAGKGIGRDSTGSGACQMAAFVKTVTNFRAP